MTPAAAGLLLPVDPVTLYAPGGEDGHGWRMPGGEPSWTGTGNLQLGPGVSDPRAGTGGGHGPFAPAYDQAGSLYLPPDAAVTEGMVAHVRGRAWVLSQVRTVLDPAYPGAGAACTVATVTGCENWPEDG